VIALVALVARQHTGPQNDYPLSIAATWLLLADLMTAVVLLAQFYVTGVARYAVVAATYALSGLLVIPFLAWFPGILIAVHPTRGDAQLMPAVWLARSAAFVACVAASQCFSSRTRRRNVARTRVGATAAAWIAGAFAAAVACAVSLFVLRRRLPPLVSGSHAAFTQTDSHVLVALAMCDFAAVALVAARSRRCDALGIWLAEALFAAGLGNALVAFAPQRHSLETYGAILQAIVSSSVVLLAFGFEMARQYRTLVIAASVDPLTNLRNRRTFETDAAFALDDAAARKSPVSLLMIDIDHFKRYNDRFGHAFGDEALRRVAALLGASARPEDIVARQGGEEFVVLLPGSNAPEAKSIAESIRGTVERDGAARGALTDAITVSVGVASAESPRQDSLARLLAAADVALYEAKERGRNRVVAERITPVFGAAGGARH
jgi:diguanylate cyclase (GGDEF)-like protein